MSLLGAMWWGMTFQKTDGTPYSGVLAYHYEPATTTLRTAYTDEPATTNAANPVVGDTRGFVSFYGYGNYRILVTASVADGAATLFDGVVKLENRPSGMREEVQATSYPSATSSNRGLLFFRTDAGGDIVSVGVNKDATGFSILRFASDTPTATEAWAKGADLASASTLTLGSDGNYFDVTGITPITAISAKAAGTIIILKFEGILTLTHNVTSLILANAVNHTTADGDVFAFMSEGSGNWREMARLSRLVTGMFLTTATITTPTLSGTITGSYTLSGTPLLVNRAPATPAANVLYADSIIKGWLHTSGAGAWTIDDDVNVSSILDNGVGDFTITWARAFANAFYAVVGVSRDSATARHLNELDTTTKTVSIVRIGIISSGVGLADTTLGVSVMAIGAQ